LKPKKTKQIDLRKIVTVEDIKTLKEASYATGDEAAYDAMMDSWQKDLDEKVSKELQEQESWTQVFGQQTASFFKTSAIAIGLFAVIAFTFPMIDNYKKAQDTAYQTEVKNRTDSGWVQFSNRVTSNNQVKNAPTGTTLETLESTPINNMWTADDVLVRYTLNLKQIPNNQIHAISHEVMYDNNVIGTGLFYTKPGEYGLSRFEKKHAYGDSKYEPNKCWIKISVHVVDAGSVPFKNE
jgi:hypothetical protein